MRISTQASPSMTNHGLIWAEFKTNWTVLTNSAWLNSWRQSLITDLNSSRESTTQLPLSNKRSRMPLVKKMRTSLQLKPLLSLHGCNNRLIMSNQLQLKSRKNGLRERSLEIDRSREKPSTSRSRSNKMSWLKAGTQSIWTTLLLVFWINLSAIFQIQKNMLKISRSSQREESLSLREQQRVKRIWTRPKILSINKEVHWKEKLKMRTSEPISSTWRITKRLMRSTLLILPKDITKSPKSWNQPLTLEREVNSLLNSKCSKLIKSIPEPELRYTKLILLILRLNSQLDRKKWHSKQKLRS